MNRKQKIFKENISSKILFYFSISAAKVSITGNFILVFTLYSKGQINILIKTSVYLIRFHFRQIDCTSVLLCCNIYEYNFG